MEGVSAWKDQPVRKPLILRGARQVGKTNIVRSFGKEYKHYIELNLEKEEDVELIKNSKEPTLYEVIENEKQKRKAFTESLLPRLQSSEWRGSFI